MPDVKKITPDEPNPDEGVGDLLPEGNESHPDGSEGDGDFTALAEKFGVDLTNMSDEAKAEVELALRTAENAVHNLREDDSLELDGLRQKAALYDRRSITQPAQTQPLPSGANAPVQEALFEGREIEAAVASDDPDALATVLTKGVAKAMETVKKELGASRLAPIEKALSTIVEMTVLDGKYPEWRKDLPKMRQVLQSHREYTLQQAYEVGVLLPRYERDKERDKDGWNKARDTRRAAVKNETKGANSRPTEETPVVYDTDMDAILAAIEKHSG